MDLRFHFATPTDWRAGNIALRNMNWSNSIQPYIKNYRVYTCPSTKSLKLTGLAAAYAAPLKTPATMSYGINGDLNSFNEAGIVAPANIISFTHFNGVEAPIGQAGSFPTIICNDPTRGCVYAPPIKQESSFGAADATCASSTVNGYTDGFYVTTNTYPVIDTYWVHSGGQNFAFVDGHAKYARLAGNPLQDPWGGYDNAGVPSGAYWDSCHSLLFRPDYSPGSN